MRQINELSHRDAQTIIAAIAAELERTGQGAAVAVADTHGELLAFLRTDGCGLPPITIAQNKAYTAAREGIPSKLLGERSRDEGFPMTNFGELRYVSWGGGVPVVVNGEVVGAVGVSGLPEAEDMRLAALGVQALAG
jgi:glc operon protein GlcG